MTNVVVMFYLTSRYIRIYSPDLASEAIPIKEIESVRVARFNKKNSEVVLNFRRKGAFLKIVN
jgi:hypothetical protein